VQKIVDCIENNLLIADVKLLEVLCKTYLITDNDNKKLYDILVKKNIYPNLTCLCEQIRVLLNSRNIDDDKLKYILETILNYKIVPTSKCIECIECVTSNNNSSRKNKYCMFDKILCILLEYGLEFNENIIVAAAKKKYSISDKILKNYYDSLSGCDKTFINDKVYYECVMTNLYIYEFNNNIYSNIAENILTMRNMFKTQSLEILVEYMKNNNLYPDRYCYYFAMNNKYYSDILLDFFATHECIPPIECLFDVKNEDTYDKICVNYKKYIKYQMDEPYKIDF
jgi:hypothetical protein